MNYSIRFLFLCNIDKKSETEICMFPKMVKQY